MENALRRPARIKRAEPSTTQHRTSSTRASHPQSDVADFFVCQLDRWTSKVSLKRFLHAEKFGAALSNTRLSQLMQICTARFPSTLAANCRLIITRHERCFLLVCESDQRLRRSTDRSHPLSRIAPSTYPISPTFMNNEQSAESSAERVGRKPGGRVTSSANARQPHLAAIGSRSQTRSQTRRARSHNQETRTPANAVPKTLRRKRTAWDVTPAPFCGIT